MSPWACAASISSRERSSASPVRRSDSSRRMSNGRCGSWREALDPPARPIAGVGDAVVQAAQAPLPELEVLGHQAVAAPVGRACGLLAMLAGEARPALLEPGAALDRLALRRGPGADARAERARVVVGGRLRAAHALDRPLDAHLALELLPEERDGGGGIGGEVAPLAALVVGEEHEAAR